MVATFKPPTKSALSTDIMPSIQATLSHLRSTGRKPLLNTEERLPTTIVLLVSLCSSHPEVELCNNLFRRAKLTDGHHLETKRSSGMMLDAFQTAKPLLSKELIQDTTCLITKEIDTASTWCALLVTQFEKMQKCEMMNTRMNIDRIENKRKISIYYIHAFLL